MNCRVIIVALLIATGAILLFARPMRKPSVTFLGYTNLNGKAVAAFKFTNGDHGAAILYADSMLWARARFSDPEQLRPWAARRYYMVDTLANRQSIILHLAPPTDGRAWRTTFGLRETDKRWWDYYNNFAREIHLPELEAKQKSIETGLIPAYQAVTANERQSLRSE